MFQYFQHHLVIFSYHVQGIETLWKTLSQPAGRLGTKGATTGPICLGKSYLRYAMKYSFSHQHWQSSSEQVTWWTHCHRSQAPPCWTRAQFWAKQVTFPISGLRHFSSHSCCHVPKVFLYFAVAQLSNGPTFWKTSFNIFFLDTKFQPVPSSSMSIQFKCMVSLRHCFADVVGSRIQTQILFGS